nr:FAST kinase domain-containing protein 3, mitochondrial [Onthophagus taurus]XP_022919923.1 FAST kinase domain-containing protein 3, mitochondrial [Onthophagus taurus]
MFKFTRAFIQAKCTHLNGYIRLSFSSAPTVELKNVTQEPTTSETIKRRNGIVAAAFASLKTAEVTEINTPHTDKRIMSATNIEELLSISNGTGISRKHALKVVSVLAEWSSNGKVSLPDFETDPRFLKLCRVLSKTMVKTPNVRSVYSKNEDLSTILGITADDEAAKLISGITLPQMVKVMTSLAHKKRRSIVLLRSLAFNITKSSNVLDLKQCGDLLYGMAILNFPDENLLEKVCFDVCKSVNDDLNKSAVIGSVLTSLGVLKYKDIDVLNCLSKWMVKHANECRPQDIFALFLTMGVLNYTPQNIEEIVSVFLPMLTPTEANKSTVWLDFVWSLVLLNKANVDQLNSVLEQKFIQQLHNEKALTVVNKLKLLNIDSSAQYFVKNYKGARLSEHLNLEQIEIPRNKEKEDMYLSVIDSLKNLASEKCFKSKVNTGSGFYIDIECILDDKSNPIPLDSPKTSNKKVAILMHQYQDMCKGSNEPSGLSNFITKLVEIKGYKVITIPYTEYRPKDKLVDRVKYLQRKLKSIDG